MKNELDFRACSIKWNIGIFNFEDIVCESFAFCEFEKLNKFCFIFKSP